MRLFVAIELSDAARGAIASLQARLRGACDGVRWVRPEMLHLTLKFLGEVADNRVAAVSEAVGGAAHECGPFRMAVRECGCFPGRGLVRVLWAGVDEPSGSLAACAERVEVALEAEGFLRERRAFSPHVTIGRLRGDRPAGGIREAMERATLDRVEQAVDRVVVMSSVLSRRGPAYAVISRAKLAGGESPPA